MIESTIFRGTDEAERRRRAHEEALAAPRSSVTLDTEIVRELCLDAGVADVGFVEVDRPALGPETANVGRLFPRARSLIAFVTVSNPDAIRSVSRAVANQAWHHNHLAADEIAAEIIAGLATLGVGAVSTAIGFPMESRPEPGTTPWELSHKIIAVEAGLGHMGIHRNVIHPRFGSFVLLETVLIDAELTTYSEPLDYNPCNGCNLCVAACPVGAVRANDEFDFFACLTHNYREFLFGFEDWVHTIADASSAEAYASKFPYEETRSFWQSLSFGPNYKAAYCQAVCPAGDDIIGPFMADRAEWRRTVVEPLRDKAEPIYVRSGTRAEHVAARNPAKRVRYVDYRVDESTPANFVLGLRHRFDAIRAEGVTCSVRFRFPDRSTLTATVADGGLEISEDTDADVTVHFAGDDYIRLLHADTELEAGENGFGMTGDPASLVALVACLS